MKRPFLLLLLSLVFVDLILLIFLINFSDNAFFTKLKNILPFTKKEFIINDPDLLYLRKNSYLIEKDIIESKQATITFKAYSTGKVFFNESIGHYLLPITVSGTNKVNLILIKKGQKINIKVARNGNINEGVAWKSEEIAYVNKIININTPLIVTVYYGSFPYDNLLKSEACKNKCKEILNNYKDYSNNTKTLFNPSRNKKTTNILTIGPINYFIIYVRE